MRMRNAPVAVARALALALASLAGSVTLFVLTVLSLCFIPLGVGVLTTPLVLRAVRAHADLRRRLADRWSGLAIPGPYRPEPPGLRGGVVGQAERCGWLLRDPATWRDVAWLAADMTGGAVTAVLGFGLVSTGVEGLVLGAGTWRPVVHAGGPYWYTFVRVTGQGTALLAALVGAVLVPVGLLAAPVLLRAHFLLARAFLAPTRRAALTARVRHLAETRYDAVDASAAELRRIERDLHDGAQARLVAVGMSLGTVEALIDKDPAQARKLLAAARADSAEALAELRDLVRGIHPPVLAERGLADAVRALALRLPLRSEVDADLPGRAPEPVESAAYFAVSELLTNAVKHARAHRIRVDMRYADGSLRISVTDDGRGGADAAGSGLSGLRRRLAAFDGVLAVSSPPGGPTMATLEIPCALAPAPSG
ncbi:sensor domain-containing protein [Streptomyces sp. B1866]|uniref:sensor histidine kinase n=1 Tax=Streptomyces sp. B1866 TaxID=3075431 RepID=UPI002890FF5C|nr:sensor domain-containing protein [Streptomyces sp. B1866]MDT3396540.1 sensor domain-containing protein [Streptomyces sp. B1866]